MLPTPTYNRLRKSKLKELVYEPSEDTFLFLDALEHELKYLNNLKPLISLEIGSGSGIVSTFLAKNLQQAKYLAIDINENACAASRETSEENEIDLEIIQSDLLYALRPKSVDIILFNAPYVPSEANEIDSKNVSAAWAGGENGRVVMDRLFPLIPKILTKHGVFYLVCIKPNKIDEIERLFIDLGFKMDIVLSRRTSIEHLFVLKFYSIF